MKKEFLVRFMIGLAAGSVAAILVAALSLVAAYLIV